VPLQLVSGTLRRSSGLGSAELEKHWLEAGREREIIVLQFGDQAASCSSEGPAQLWLIEGADKGVSERIGHGGGEVVNITPIGGVLSQADASEGDEGIANITDAGHGLPGPVALDA
jgi:hypothetical protein